MSNALVAARLAVVCTDKVLYAKALAAFWHVHAALEASIAKNAQHQGGDFSLLAMLEQGRNASNPAKGLSSSSTLHVKDMYAIAALKEITRLKRSLARAAAFEADLLYLLG